MSKIEEYWGKDKRFYSYNSYCMNNFETRMQKIPINAGFTCPNRDGSKGLGGCTYCNNVSFNPFYGNNSKSISLQIYEGIEFFSKKYKSQNYLAYFQAYTNTYDELTVLKQKYKEALSNRQIKGLVIGTRPDCISDELLDFLEELAKKKYVSVEYGLESIYDKTLEYINRCHTYADSVEAINRTANRGINVGVHLIFGLPQESKKMISDTAKEISKLKINSLKIHQLQIIKSTIMADQFKTKPDQFSNFSVEEYVDLVIEFLEKLRPDIVVERFISESPPNLIVNSNWGGIRTYEIVKLIEDVLVKKDTFQGKKFFIPKKKK
ncbi:MAG: TIGR01212 family radical SAM protein [Melioribacteraceae bacterium]|nr:TIGR01212 family radical SAM protein [Melioribacteraceae bacterium]